MRVILANDGYKRNPLSSGKIRNKMCPCKSGEKIKNCHGMANFIPDEYLESFRQTHDLLAQGRKVNWTYQEKKESEDVGV